MAEKTVGILTGGGDCPGLNAVIRAAVRKGITQYDYRFKGIQKGWKGMMECDWEPLGLEEISGILPKGGTILGTSRTNPFKEGDGGDIVAENMRRMKLDALIAIGGEDTLGVASKLNDLDVPVVGVPKTIDNDLNGTDYTFGFDTAVNIVTEAIDRIHTTAESHNRVMVLEVMGRHSGWIALHAGLAGGADMILIPEQKYTVDEIVQTIQKRHNRGKDFSIVAGDTRMSTGFNIKSRHVSKIFTMCARTAAVMILVARCSSSLITSATCSTAAYRDQLRAGARRLDMRGQCNAKSNLLVPLHV